MRTIHAGVLFIYCHTVLWTLAAPQTCLAQGSPGTRAQGSSDAGEAAIPRESPALTERFAALLRSSAPAPGPSARRPELASTSVRTTGPVTNLADTTDSTVESMPGAPQQGGLDTTSPSAQSGTTPVGQSGLLALDGTESGVNAGSGSVSGQGGSAGVGRGSSGVGGVSDTSSLGNPGGLVFDGAGNIVSGVQSAFGDVPVTYTGRQEWPELVGTNALVAKAKLKGETGLNVLLVPKGSVVTTDYRADRIRIYFDPATYLVVQPRPSVG